MVGLLKMLEMAPSVDKVFFIIRKFPLPLPLQTPRGVNKCRNQ